MIKSTIPCQAVVNKIHVEPLPKKQKDLERLGKILISKRILSVKIAIVYNKGEFAKLKGSIANIPADAGKPMDRNVLTLIRLREGGTARNAPPLVYFAFNLLVTHPNFMKLSNFSQNLSGINILIFVFKIWTGFSSGNTFSGPGIIYFEHVRLGK